MKKTFLALGLAAAMLVPTQQTSAIIGVGLNAGQDSYAIPGKTYTNLFLPNSGIEFTRKDMNNPIGGGVYLFIDFLPVVDIELELNMFLNKFDVEYINPNVPDVSEEFGWARTAGYLSIQRKLFKIPMFSIFAGGGLSFHASVPLLDDKFVEEFLDNDPTKPLEIKDLEDEIIKKTGFHIELGGRFKPILIPFAVNVKFRHTFVDGIVPGKKSFSTISAGFGFQI